MTLYLVVAILLFFLLFFVYTEGFNIDSEKSESKGFYTDDNVSSATNALVALNKKLATLKKTVETISSTDLSAMDAVSSVIKVLSTNESDLYTRGVITNVQSIKKELDIYQEDVMALKDFLVEMDKLKGVYQYDETEKRKMPFTLLETIDSLTQRANQISGRLNKIPSS